MSKNMIKLVLFFILGLGNVVTFACSAPAPGTFLSHNELIQKTKTILLAELIEGTKSRFRVAELLKGNSEKEFQLIRVRSKQPHVSNDFEGHTLAAFWTNGNEGVIRSPYRGGACYPDFTFVVGEKYLIFVESYGNHHSAEIIKSSDDKWYKYIKTRVTPNKVLKEANDHNNAS